MTKPQRTGDRKAAQYRQNVQSSRRYVTALAQAAQRVGLRCRKRIAGFWAETKVLHGRILICAILKFIPVNDAPLVRLPLAAQLI